MDETVATELAQGMDSVSGREDGFIRAFATAKAEPVSATISRALRTGAERAFGPDQTLVPPTRSDAGAEQTLSTELIRATIRRLCALRPMILIIDEFGKNLEAYAESGHPGDPYLLQELAESTQGVDPLPLVIITMQHLSFDEYVQETSAARRREWAKVQGRFQDIPYIETAAQSRRLMVASLERRTKRLDAASERWIKRHYKSFEALGLRDLIDDAAAAIPMHPLTLAVLPDLCTRYGQNERTLFSFMAGSEPLAVPAFLAESEWNLSQPIPLLGLDRVYDYFLDSAGSMIGVSENASRWLEIETRIRDTAGLTAAELRAIKNIGVLNLVSNGGRIRASRAMLEFSLLTGQEGTATVDEVDQVLCSLEDAGLVVYRAFSDEYRIWQGSDYDLRRAVEGARRQCLDKDLAILLNEATPLEPAVAGRHSQHSGILRIFEQRFSNLDCGDFDVSESSLDGVVLYATTESLNRSPLPSRAGKPIVVITPDDLSAVKDAAVEAAALQLALQAAEDEKADWVAKRELVERTAAAQQQLQSLIGRTWNSDADWELVGNDAVLGPEAGLSAVLSRVSDLAYTHTPRVANEMIARRELTSQGAKARRVLIEAMLLNPTKEAFGLEGYGPERAMYEALYRSTKMHLLNPEGAWEIQPPLEPHWKHTWLEIDAVFKAAETTRTNLREIITRLTAPPIGLKNGIVPLLIVTSLLVRSDEIALYEHGSLVLSLDDAVAERLTRNPSHFTVKNTGVRTGHRRVVIDALADRLKITGGRKQPTFLNVATALFRELRLLPPYVQKTKYAVSPEALAVRNAFHTAGEPDVLLFDALPKVLRMRPFQVSGRIKKTEAEAYANRLADIIVELRGAYDSLLDDIKTQLAAATSTNGTLSEIRHLLTGQATNLDGRVLEPQLRAFVGALARPLEDRAWLENVAMVVAEGHAPRVWTDDIAARFPLKIAELGGAMRRTQALLYERLAATAEPDSFATSRMTLTRPDGTETIALLSITEREKESIDTHFEPLLDQLSAVWGSRATACRMLMARLAVEDADVSNGIDATKDGKDIQHG
ncbi:hypothetical protein R4282_10660 [Rhodococcus oxybenzonivorans]|uniref:hypothetical protein n=1 Tax=Rhodococcus oxybenzonivorans TaxID=1990687 RepID=UPI002954AADB|nr:hypothetical protein [Rhodococcus oxybenzonivorans]MDV7353467.1 hypothetical protein [Rhodococcus oxybenzonivorans]